MADASKLEQALPVAPLKIVALDSAAQMGKVINDYLAAFRKETHKDLTNDPAFQDIMKIIFLPTWTAPVSAPARARESSGNPSAARISISCWMSATTASPIR